LSAHKHIPGALRKAACAPHLRAYQAQAQA
jgi:hypothetical protein